MTDQLVRNGTGQAYILVHNKLYKMPNGSNLGISTQLRPFLFSDIYSAKGKLRAGMDLIRSRSKTQEDQSLGTFLRGRFGNELVESLLEPLIAGVYSSDIDQMSLQATFPNFFE